MTSNQIAYAKLMEDKRANAMQEVLTAQRNAETERSNRVQEVLKAQANTETERANRQQEVLKQQAQTETERSNRMTEVIKSQANDEVIRHNMETERKDLQSISETIRANTARENISYKQLQQDWEKFTNELTYTAKNWALNVRKLEVQESQFDKQLTQDWDKWVGDQSLKGMQITNDYELRSLHQAAEDYRNELEKERLTWEKEKGESDVFKNISASLSSFISTLAALIAIAPK